MGILLCEQNFRDVWIRNESVRAEIGQILHTDTHTTAAKLVVRMGITIIILAHKSPIGQYHIYTKQTKPFLHCTFVNSYVLVCTSNKWQLAMFKLASEAYFKLKANQLGK